MGCNGRILKKIPRTYRKGCTTTHTNALEMRVKHACNSYKCITRLIVTGTRHHYAGWAWSCTNFVHSAGTARKTPPMHGIPDMCQILEHRGLDLECVFAPVEGLLVIVWRQLENLVFFSVGVKPHHNVSIRYFTASRRSGLGATSGMS